MLPPAVVGLLIVLATGAQGTSMASGTPDAWTQEKCVRYERAWRELLPTFVAKGVTGAFVSGNEAFIAAGCANGADVCPASPADFELANALTIAAMNFGTASTFLPFVCRSP